MTGPMQACGSLLIALVAGSGACAQGEPFQARFAVRGRVHGERTLTFAIEAQDGPLAPESFRAAIVGALATWQETGCVRFVPATAGRAPDVVFSWRCGPHGSCTPFGADPAVAHAGPVAPGTFVHFDAARAWGRSLSLRQAALHEIGHVLGLEHGTDETAVMYAEPSPRREALARSDLCALRSLYGGGAAGPSDLVVMDSGAHPLSTLYAVAPPELTGWTLFDTDGDGDEEVLVWRTDRAGQGALWVFHFANGPALERTVGPLYGVVGPGLEPSFRRLSSGERVLILEPEQGSAQARVFDDHGIPALHDGEVPPVTAMEHAETLAGDLDGDGRRETVARGR